MNHIIAFYFISFLNFYSFAIIVSLYLNNILFSTVSSNRLYYGRKIKWSVISNSNSQNRKLNIFLDLLIFFYLFRKYIPPRIEIVPKANEMSDF